MYDKEDALDERQAYGEDCVEDNDEQDNSDR
jgi:hypothetical protein